MPGLLRGVARTAAVVGTANAVSHKQHQKYARQDAAAQQGQAQQAQQGQAQQAQQAQQYQAQQAPAPQQYAAPAAPAVAEDPTVAKLNQLASLHAQGILTDAEFASAKAKALGI